VSGEIDVSVAGEHVATLSAEEAALLADVLWDLGTSTKRRGAITIAAALKAAAHRSGLKTSVDLKDGETGAVHAALDGMTDHEDGLSGLSERLPRTDG
jgi:hypothetical protein